MTYVEHKKDLENVYDKLSSYILCPAGTKDKCIFVQTNFKHKVYIRVKYCS